MVLRNKLVAYYYGVRWLLSLGLKFMRVVPFSTIFIVFFTIVSQLSSLLSSFLPLKVIILLGSDGVPKYFPSFLEQMGRDHLIIVLSSSAALFFLLNQCSELVIKKITNFGTRLVLIKSEKLHLFENQDRVAANAYNKYSKALAGCVFSIFVVCFLFFAYSPGFFLILFYLVFCFLFTSSLCLFSDAFLSFFKGGFRKYLKINSNIGFFFFFGFLLIDFVVGLPPNVILAIVSLLLCRQLMGRFSSAVADFFSLYLQKSRLEALFFHGKIFLPKELNANQKEVWSFLDSCDDHKWWGALLKEVTGNDFYISSVSWMQSGINDVVYLKIECDSLNILVKVFSPKRKSLAVHEFTLTSLNIVNLPSPTWLGNKEIDSFVFVFYKLPCGLKRSNFEVKNSSLSICSSLSSVKVPIFITNKYVRSHALLWQRIDEVMISRLEIAASGKDQLSEIRKLKEELPFVISVIKALPLSLVNWEVKKDSVWYLNSDTDKFILLSWGRWCIEPIGSGWPVSLIDNGGVCREVNCVKNKRSDIQDLSFIEVELSALIYAIERDSYRQNYSDAINYLPSVLDKIYLLRKMRG